MNRCLSTIGFLSFIQLFIDYGFQNIHLMTSLDERIIWILKCVMCQTGASQKLQSFLICALMWWWNWWLRFVSMNTFCSSYKLFLDVLQYLSRRKWYYCRYNNSQQSRPFGMLELICRKFASWWFAQMFMYVRMIHWWTIFIRQVIENVFLILYLCCW